MASSAPGGSMDDSLLFPTAPGDITPTESFCSSETDSESFSGIDDRRPSALPVPVSTRVAPFPFAPAPVAPANYFTFWGLLRGAAVNLLIPFLNGMMLGFGELFAYGFASRYGWSWTTVSEPRNGQYLTALLIYNPQIFPFRRNFRRAPPGADIEAPRHRATCDTNPHVFPGRSAAAPAPAPDIPPSGVSHL